MIYQFHLYRKKNYERKQTVYRLVGTDRSILYPPFEKEQVGKVLEISEMFLGLKI